MATNFDHPESLRKAAAGFDIVFAMGTPFETDPETETRQGIALLDATLEAGIGHIVYSSVAGALDDTGIPHFESKARIEEHLATLDVPHTVVAPVAFLENITAPWAAASLRDGRYEFGVPAETPLQQVAVADIASFSALVIERPEQFSGKRIELASVEVTGLEVAEALSTWLGRTMRYVEIPLQAFTDSGNEDMHQMLTFFRTGGYQVDINALHAQYPEVSWHSLTTWGRKQDWSSLTSA